MWYGRSFQDEPPFHYSIKSEKIEIKINRRRKTGTCKKKKPPYERNYHRQ